MKKKVIFALLIVFFIVSFGFRDKKQEIVPKTLKIGEVALNIGVADTDAERIQGLSGREKLEENEGLLFVFEKESYHSIWMKDMNFPIDIAWLDKNKKIIHIENAVGPETYPKVFNAAEQSLFVLETNSHFFENAKIKIGDQAEF